MNHFFSWFSGVTFGYEGQKPLFKNLDFGIDMDSRSELVSSAWGAGLQGQFLGTSLTACLLLAVCIVGPNGVGKSTLLLLLTGGLTPVSPAAGTGRGTGGKAAVQTRGSGSPLPGWRF